MIRAMLVLLVLSILLAAANVSAQRTTPRARGGQQTGTDEYTRKLVENMAAQGVPKQAIADKIKHQAKGANNARKIVDKIQADKAKAEKMKKQKRQPASSQKKPQKQAASKGYRREL